MQLFIGREGKEVEMKKGREPGFAIMSLRKWQEDWAQAHRSQGEACH